MSQPPPNQLRRPRRSSCPGCLLGRRSSCPGCLLRRRTGASAAVLAAAVSAVALAGCATRPSGAVPPAKPLPVSIPLGTSLSTPAATWATVRTGGPAVGGKYWQLLVRPAGSSKWSLVTPPGVADNGGLAVAASRSTATVGFVPSADLRFSPLAMTTDNGAHWITGLLNAGLLAAPSAMAALPGGRLLAITSKGAEESGPGGKHWSTLATFKSLVATPAGRKCGLTALTAAASKLGSPLLAGTCTHPGVPFVVERGQAGWIPITATLPGSLAKRPVTVLQMVSVTSGTSMLLGVGSGRGQQVVPAWLPGHQTTLTVGRPFVRDWRPVTSTYFSAATGMGVILGGKDAQATVPGATERLLEAKGEIAPRSLPAPDTSLAFSGAPDSGQFTALVPGLDTVQVWQWDTNGTWHRTQVVTVPSAPA
jgi:hypothetical protein